MKKLLLFYIWLLPGCLGKLPSRPFSSGPFQGAPAAQDCPSWPWWALAFGLGLALGLAGATAMRRWLLARRMPGLMDKRDMDSLRAALDLLEGVISSARRRGVVVDLKDWLARRRRPK